MPTKTLSIFGERSENRIPMCPKCQSFMRLALSTGKDGLEEYGYECSDCGTSEVRREAISKKEDGRERLA